MKPILFNTDMVRAILKGRKTVTRRVVRLKYSNTHLEMFPNKYGTRLIEKQNFEPGVTIVKNPDRSTTHKLLACMKKTPPYCPGDILYVRAERLQEMTDDDFVCDFGFCREAIRAVGRDALALSLWDSTIKKLADRALYGWAANPWVWAIEFERCGKPEEGAAK